MTGGAYLDVAPCSDHRLVDMLVHGFTFRDLLLLNLICRVLNFIQLFIYQLLLYFNYLLKIHKTDGYLKVWTIVEQA